MSEDMMRVQVYYPRSFIELVDELAHKYSLTRSEMLRDLSMKNIEEDGNLDEDELISQIDENKMELARKKREQEKLRDRQEIKEMKASFEDRIRRYFRQRLEGDKAYSPIYMADLADGYKEEADIWFDDSSEIDNKEEYVEEQKEIYEAGYFARQHANEIDAELDRDDRERSWMDIGEDLFKLRSRSEEVVDHIRSVADNRGVGWDSEAVIDSVGDRWSVGKAAVMLLMEQMVAKDSHQIHDMLREGGDAVADPTDHNRALTNGHDESESEPEISIPTEPTDEMLTIAIEKYRTTGSVETTRIGLENTDSVECTLPQAEKAAEIAQDRVDGETVSTEEVS